MFLLCELRFVPFQWKWAVTGGCSYALVVRGVSGICPASPLFAPLETICDSGPLATYYSHLVATTTRFSSGMGIEAGVGRCRVGERLTRSTRSGDRAAPDQFPPCTALQISRLCLRPPLMLSPSPSPSPSLPPSSSPSIGFRAGWLWIGSAGGGCAEPRVSRPRPPLRTPTDVTDASAATEGSCRRRHETTQRESGEGVCGVDRLERERSC